MTKFRVDKSWRRPRNGDTVIAGSPIKLFTLTDRGRDVAERIERRDEIDPSTIGLAHRLFDAGAVVPVLEPGDASLLDKLSVVIPVYAREMRDVDAVRQLANNLLLCNEVIIVDDHSPYPVSGTTTFPSNCKVIRNEWNMGPGGSRNAGLAAVSTDFVGFVDADVHLDAFDLHLLASHFSDDAVVAVAPRIIGDSTAEDVLGRFEETDSPLDLGQRPGRVRAGTRVSYVPTACLVARTAAVRAEGGFDPELTTGEDVDLVWRLDSPIHWVLYESAVEVCHDARKDFWSWLDQRRGYGRSAAALAKRHEGALAPVVTNAWTLVILGLLTSRRRWLALPVAAVTAITLAQKLRKLPNRWYEASRLAVLGHWHTLVSIARAMSRVWLPPALLLAVVSRSLRRYLFAAMTLPALFDWTRKRPRLDPLRYLALKLLDDASYAVGVWEGCVAERNIDPLKPRITKP